MVVIMATQFIPINEVSDFERLREQSAEGPVVVFKHDTACPISAAAYRQLSRLDGDIPLIDVDLAQDLSMEVARQTGVQHESPQVIVLRNGAAAWSASLHDITAEAVVAAVEAA